MNKNTAHTEATAELKTAERVLTSWDCQTSPIGSTPTAQEKTTPLGFNSQSLGNGHTPGPWEDAGLAIYAGKVQISQGVDETTEEAITTGLKVGHGSELEYPEARANARLIASSPDLLEACQFALYTLRGMTTEQFAVGADKMTRAILETAIAKATGKES